MDDAFDHDSKECQRVEFATMCRRRRRCRGHAGVLYTDSPAGGATAKFLKLGMARHELHPCNVDADATRALAKRFPGVCCETGDILDVHRKKKWHAIWFDVESNWCEKVGGRWDEAKLPDFKRGLVVAVTLSARCMSLATFPSLLQSLLEDHGAEFVQDCRAVRGKRERNMVFGVASFSSQSGEMDILAFVDKVLPHAGACMPLEEFKDKYSDRSKKLGKRRKRLNRAKLIAAFKKRNVVMSRRKTFAYGGRLHDDVCLKRIR